MLQQAAMPRKPRAQCLCPVAWPLDSLLTLIQCNSFQCAAYVMRVRAFRHMCGRTCLGQVVDRLKKLRPCQLHGLLELRIRPFR